MASSAETEPRDGDQLAHEQLARLFSGVNLEGSLHSGAFDALLGSLAANNVFIADSEGAVVGVNAILGPAKDESLPLDQSFLTALQAWEDLVKQWEMEFGQVCLRHVPDPSKEVPAEILQGLSSDDRTRPLAVTMVLGGPKRPELDARTTEQSAMDRFFSSCNSCELYSFFLERLMRKHCACVEGKPLTNSYRVVQRLDAGYNPNFVNVMTPCHDLYYPFEILTRMDLMPIKCPTFRHTQLLLEFQDVFILFETTPMQLVSQYEQIFQEQPYYTWRYIDASDVPKLRATEITAETRTALFDTTLSEGTGLLFAENRIPSLLPFFLLWAADVPRIPKRLHDSATKLPLSTFQMTYIPTDNTVLKCIILDKTEGHYVPEGDEMMKMGINQQHISTCFVLAMTSLKVLQFVAEELTGGLFVSRPWLRWVSKTVGELTISVLPPQLKVTLHGEFDGYAIDYHYGNGIITIDTCCVLFERLPFPEMNIMLNPECMPKNECTREPRCGADLLTEEQKRYIQGKILEEFKK